MLSHGCGMYYVWFRWILLYIFFLCIDFCWERERKIKQIFAVMGWVSPTILILLSDDTPLTSGPLNSDELSWISSITNIGAFCGILTFGILNSSLGCKRTMLFLGFPSASFWILIYFGKTYYHVLVARFFAGWTGGGMYIDLYGYNN